MDALEECVDYRSLYETLNSLPETLDETYERMIRILLKRNQTSGILLLQFLVFAERHLWIDEAVDIIAVDLKSSPHFQERYRMPNELEISSICSSLVTVGMVESTTLGAVERTGRTLQLAHFSVKEYLMSDRLPSILQQHFTEVNAHGSIVNTSLGYLTSVLSSYKDDRTTLEGMTPLIVAVISGNKKAVEILLDMSPLKSTGDFKAINEAKYGFIDIPEKALSRTALHLAAERGSTEIARLLLIGGANVRAMDIFGGSPIHIAAEEHNLEIVQLLVEYGSDLKACDSEGRTPLRCARDSLTFGLAGARNEVVEWLEYMEGRG